MTLASAFAWVSLIFYLSQQRNPSGVLPGIPLAIFWAMMPTVALGIHVFRLEARLELLEVELDTRRQIKEAQAPRNDVG